MTLAYLIPSAHCPLCTQSTFVPPPTSDSVEYPNNSITSQERMTHTEKSFNFFLAARNKRSRTHVISAILQRGGSCSRFAAGSVPIWFPSQGKGPGPQRRSPLLISCQSMRALSTPAPSVKPAKNSSISPPRRPPMTWKRFRRCFFIFLFPFLFASQLVHLDVASRRRPVPRPPCSELNEIFCLDLIHFVLNFINFYINR